MTTIKKGASGRNVRVRAAGKALSGSNLPSGKASGVYILSGNPQAGSIIEYARKLTNNKKRSIELAQRAKIVTKSGELTAHYKK